MSSEVLRLHGLMTTSTSQTTLNLGLAFKTVVLNETQIHHGTVVKGLCRPAGLTGSTFFHFPRWAGLGVVDHDYEVYR